VAWQVSRTKHNAPLQKGPDALSLKTISSRQFNRFLPAGNHLGTVIGEEVEWFADDPENAIGTIAFNTDARGWNYAILKRDWKGDFQVCDLKRRFQSLQTTRADFLLTMRTGREANGRSLQCRLGNAGHTREDCAAMPWGSE
jgi:hypothetical protein